MILEKLPGLLIILNMLINLAEIVEIAEIAASAIPLSPLKKFTSEISIDFLFDQFLIESPITLLKFFELLR